MGGYLNRRKNRACARFILKILHEKSPDHDLHLAKEDWNNPNIPALTMEHIQSRTKKYSLAELKRATRLLDANQHITLCNLGNPVKPDNKATLILTIAGKDALLDGYYEQENKKDLLEVYELNIKLMMPIISIFKK